MSDADTVLTEVDVRHLLCRSGFGARLSDVGPLVGKTRGAAADRLLAFTPASVELAGPSINDLRAQWIAYMLQVAHPLQEKLVLFWHDHFATANAKVRDAALMARQNVLLRRCCKGNFKDLVKAINRDPAMMVFLDTVLNRPHQPNENYARELQELFTLGVHDFNGQSNFTQDDIVQIARAFSGWNYDSRRRTAFLNRSQHDFMTNYPRRGPKVIYRSTGGFGPGGVAYASSAAPEGPEEIDRIVDILFAHRDSDGKHTVARFIARKLLRYFALPGPKRQLEPEPELTPIVDAVVADARFDQTWDLGALLRAIFVQDAFYATAAPAPFTSTTPKSVKWPVDYTVSTLRMLDMQPVAEAQSLAGGDQSVSAHLANMGQALFDPPSVFGWDWGNAWISSATLLARYAFARDIAAARSGGRSGLRPQELVDVRLTTPREIVDAVTTALGVTDQLTAADRAPLVDYLTDGGMVQSLDLTSDAVRQIKLNGLFALVLQTPAYQLH
jgi:uncharacterized protein (DUF1800 family)